MVTAYRKLSAVKNAKTATDRLVDFKLGMGVIIKADKDWRDVGRPSSCNAFAIATFLVYKWITKRIYLTTFHWY